MSSLFVRCRAVVSAFALFSFLPISSPALAFYDNLLPSAGESLFALPDAKSGHLPGEELVMPSARKRSNNDVILPADISC